jgi:hypothetical protein
MWNEIFMSLSKHRKPPVTLSFIIHRSALWFVTTFTMMALIYGVIIFGISMLLFCFSWVWLRMMSTMEWNERTTKILSDFLRKLSTIFSFFVFFPRNCCYLGSSLLSHWWEECLNLYSNRLVHLSLRFSLHKRFVKHMTKCNIVFKSINGIDENL